jgi:hypothetical protein
MKYALVAVAVLLLGFLAAGNTDVLTRTFFPEETLVAQISLGNENNKAEKREGKMKTEDDLKLSFCSFAAAPIKTTGSIGPVVLNEVAWMGDKENFLNEWIELKNVSDRMVDVSGWQFLDKDEQIKVIFSDEIDSGNFLLLRRGEDFSGNLRNSEEGLRLFDNECNLIDEVFAAPDWPAGDNKNKLTMERAADFSWVSSSVAGGTPNKINSIRTATVSVAEPEVKPSNLEEKAASAAQTSVLISEVMVGTEENGAEDEFVELYNPGDDPVNLSGWSLKKKNSSGREENLVSAASFSGIIPAKDFFLVTHKNYKGNIPADLVYSANSRNLAYTKNGVYLYSGDGVVDSASWNEIPKNSSYERVSWNENRFEIRLTPTPENSK